MSQRPNYKAFALFEAIVSLMIVMFIILLLVPVVSYSLQVQQKSVCWLNQAAEQLMELHRVHLRGTSEQVLIDDKSDHTSSQLADLQNKITTNRNVANETIGIQSTVLIACSQKEERIQIEKVHEKTISFSFE